MVPIEIEYIKPYGTETEWETTKETSKFLKLNKAALKCNEVIFDEFYAYENNDLLECLKRSGRAVSSFRIIYEWI